MGWLDEFWELQNQPSQNVSNDQSPVVNSPSFTFNNKYEYGYSLAREQLSAHKDFAPVSTSVTDRMTVKNEEEDKKWYQGYLKKGALDDGFSLENITKTILGTGADIAEDITAGIVSVGELAVDGLLSIAPYAYKATVNQYGGIMSLEQQKMHDEIVADAQKDIGAFVKKDLYDENAVAKKILSGIYGAFDIAYKTQNGMQITEEDLIRSRELKAQAMDYMNNQMESDSTLDEKSDALVQSAGRLAAQKGLTLVGVPWFITSGVTTAGGQMENALRDDATYDQAAGSALISAGGEILSEKLFGGDFFVDDAAADIVTPYIATAISNKFLRGLAKGGFDIAGEGFEEIFSDGVSKLGSALYKEESLAEILFSEQALDDYIDSFVGGIALGGAMNAVNAVQANSNGADFTTGLPKEVDSAVDEIYNSLVSALEHFRKVSPTEKRQIYSKVLEAFSNPVEPNTHPVEENPVSEPEIESVVEEAQPIETAVEPTVSKTETVQSDAFSNSTIKTQQDVDKYSEAPVKQETKSDVPVEKQISDLEKFLELMYDKRQSIQSEFANESDSAARDEIYRRYKSEWYYLNSEILQAEEKLNSLKNPAVQSENVDVAPVVSDEDSVRFSEDTANIVAQMVSEDSQAGEQTISERQKVYSIDGFTIRRVLQKNTSGGERYLINVVSPDGLYYLGHTDKDINAFYGTVSDAIGKLMAEEYSAQGGVTEAPVSEDEVASVVNESLTTEEAPVTENFSAPEVVVAENATTTEVDKLRDERQVLQDTIMSRVEVGQVDETTEMLAKKWHTADSKIRAAEAGKTEASPKVEKPKTITEKIQQNDRKTHFLFEKLFRVDTSDNRGKYNAVLEGTKIAQDVIANGTEGVKSISDIFSQIKGTDLDDFNAYLYHYLNIDRTTLESRFGKENRPVFGEEGKDAEGNRYIKSYVPAEQSQQIVDDLEAKHPEFKAVAEEVYAYCDYLLRVRVESGALTQEKYDEWREMYPHYVPISRTRWDKQVSDDLVEYLNNFDTAAPDSQLEDVLGDVRYAAAIFEVRRVGDDLRLAMDSLVDQTFRAFWDASLVPLKSRPDTQNNVAPVDAETTDVPITEAVTEDAPVVEAVASVEETVAETPIEESVQAHTFEAPVAEEAAPVAEAEAPVAEEVDAPVIEEAQTSDDVSNTTPVAEATPVTPKPKTEAPKTPLIDAVSPKTNKKGVGQKILDAWHAVQEFTLDKGTAFERLAKKNNNRQLEADWDMIRRVPSIAQHLIGNGSVENGVRSLTAIHEQVKNGKMEQDFSDYLGHLRNMDGLSQYSRYGITNRSFMGREASVAKSGKEIKRLEAKHPEFKQLAEDVYTYNKYLINQMVEHGVITQDFADMWSELYPHYVPMRTSGDKNVPVLESMAQFTQQVQYAIAMNDFGRNLKNTLDPNTDHTVEEMDITSFFNGLDAGGNLFNLTGGENPTFTIYEDGYVSTFNITKDMYIALKPTGDLLSLSIPLVSHANDLRRNLITAYNPYFTLKNAVKDVQEIMVNSQHPLETYATLKTAIEQIYTEGDWYREYMENGGGSDRNFDFKHTEFGEGRGVKAKIETKTPLKYILDANNMVEMTPRLAEYIASRQAGRSIEVSMLDAARVTTNFAAGGDLTKFLNRNGATFLNASVQGALQHVRNFNEAAHAGAKGWASLAGRYVAANLPAILLNGLIWDDDEDYQALPDYISNNYYVVWKYGDGKFIRIPKGRTAAVMQEAIKNVISTASGDDEADWGEFLKLFVENIAPNNPASDNMFAPIDQVRRNETWYGEDIVPYRLRFTKDENGNEIEIPKEEQFDEKTDAVSIAIGQWLGVSPKKVNYLLDQYGGVLGDTFLPMMTPKAESPIDNPAMKLFAPLRDIFTTDSVLNNKVTGDFYDTLESAEAQAKSENATQEDKLRSGILISANVEISELMKEQREIQTDDSLSDSEKYKRNRELKEEINALQEEALEAVEDYSVDGNYAEAGGKRYNYDSEDDTWWEVKPTLADGKENPYYIQEQLSHDKLGMSYSDFWNGKKPPEDFEGKTYYAEYNGKRYNYDTEENGWFEIKPKTKDGEDNWYYQQEQIAHNDLGISYEDFWNNREAYGDAIYVASNGVDQGYGTPYYETVKSAIGLDRFTQIAGDMADIKTKVDENGNDIPYSKYQSVKEYVYGLDIPDIEKHIIFRAEYPKTKTNAYAIVKYLDQNTNISNDSFWKILDELGYKVDSYGNITW